MPKNKKFANNILQRLRSAKPAWMLAIYAFLNVLATGMGMGVPFFNILLGLPTGWALTQWFAHRYAFGKQLIGKILLWSALTASLTVVFMLALWGPSFPRISGTDADIINFGIPMILFEPKASFIGWMVLMTLISPFLQMLVCVFSAIFTLYLRIPKDMP